MLLYHFTSRDNLRSILRTGLSRGVVPVSSEQRLNAVWLTADAGPGGHGLESGGDFMTDLDRREAYEWTGVMPPPGARFPKSAEVRITVDLPPGDRNLHEWLPWARRQVEPEWLAFLHPVAGGNLKRAKSWRLYFGTVQPEAFLAVDELEGSMAQPEARPRLRLVS